MKVLEICEAVKVGDLDADKEEFRNVYYLVKEVHKQLFEI